MPYFLMTREARFTHRQTFVVKARNAEYAGYVESIDVDRYRLLKGENENRSGWNTEAGETKEISAEEAKNLFETKDRAGVQGEDADHVREECAKLVEEFAKRGPATQQLLDELAKEIRRKKSYPTSGADLDSWPERDDHERWAKHQEAQ